MRILIRDLAPGQEYALAFRSNDGDGNVSDWSQVQRLTTTNDLMPPGNVTGLTWADSNSSFVGAWNSVTKNNDGSPLKDFRDYHCEISNGSSSVHLYPTTNHFEFTQEQNIKLFGVLQTTLTLTVTARDRTYNESKIPVSLTATPDKPPTPYTPTLSNYLGLIQVDCNGNSNSGSAMPRNVTYYEIHTGGSDGFTTTTSTYNGRLAVLPGKKTSYIVSGLVYGTPTFIRVIAVNTLGKKSDPSGTATATPARISGLDIQNNQIAPEQLNWTSLGIPGGNAYYKGTAPTTADAIGGSFKVGDVWYNTSAAYATSKWNGTGWALDTSVGFIAGTKIIAGTITADAIATNLFSAYFAKINQAFIDNAYITYIDAGKITAGILQSKATAVYGGVSQPAWSLDINGNAVFNNAAVYGSIVLGKSTASSTNNASATVKSYNYSAGNTGWAIKGDGSVEFNNGSFRGQLVTGTGRRIEIGNGGNPAGADFAGGTASEINFYSAAGVLSTLHAYTGGVTGQDRIAMGVPISYSGVYDDMWNYVNITNKQLMSIYSGNIAMMVGNNNRKFGPSNALTSGSFDLYTTSTNGNSSSDKMLFTASSAYFSSWFPYVSFTVDSGASSNGLWVDFNNNGGEAHIAQVNASAANAAPALQLVNNNGFGGSVGYYYNPSSGSGEAIEMKSWDYVSFIPVRASAFNVSSDPRVKTNINNVDTSAILSDVMSMKVRRYNRLDKHGKPNPVEEVGFLATEVPDQLIAGNPTDDSLRFIDLYQTVTYLYGALQEAVTEYRSAINDLKNGKK